jgi:CheY-like chemotaxis protein
MKILICEDNPMAMKTLSVVLEREGFDADVADDGNVGIEMLEKNDYDLLVVDIHLPYRSGLELIKFVRSEQGKDTPVIILSAFSDNQMQRQAGELIWLPGSNLFSTNKSCADFYYFYLLGLLSPEYWTFHSFYRRK